MIIAVDFDGTIVEDRYPEIGREVPFATQTLRMLAEQHHHRIILWTVREGECLQEALDWCTQRGVEFFAVNKDYPEESDDKQNYSRKIKADIFIDDRNICGVPDWGVIYRMITERKSYRDILFEEVGMEDSSRKRRFKLFGR